MNVSTMHMNMIFDPDTCVDGADINDAYIHSIPLILMQLYVMHISLIVDPDVYWSDAYMYDLYICDS